MGSCLLDLGGESCRPGLGVGSGTGLLGGCLFRGCLVFNGLGGSFGGRRLCSRLGRGRGGCLLLESPLCLRGDAYLLLCFGLRFGG